MNNPDKMRFETPNLTAENVAKIAELFPGAVTEGKINFDLLRSLLGDEVYSDEAYEFTWVGKKAAIAEAGRPIRMTLRPFVKESKNWDTTENLYIEGDNLDVLKLLQESYLGKIKMIYIDPPYNTGNDFVYRDNFTRDKDEYDEETGVYDEDGDRLFRNTESNGRFHSDWCSMMYPRLVFARNLLHDDGVIFISIDDNELVQLRKICDEVFGASNYISCIAVMNNPRGRQSDTFVATVHENLICYAKKLQSCKLNGMPLTNEQKSEYCYCDEYGAYRLLGLRQRGSASLREDRPDMYFPIYVNPTTDEISLDRIAGFECVFPKKSDGRDGRWMWGDKKCRTDLIRLVAKYIAKRNEYDIYVKDYLNRNEGERTRKYRTIWDDKTINNQVGTQEVKKLLGGDYMSFPKSSQYIKMIVQMGSDRQSIILDFFSGSATTAHAVLQLNAEDGGKRKFIMVQLQEPCPEGSEAAKAGYANICEIGKERIRRAGEKIVDSLQLSDDSGRRQEEMRRYGCIKLSRSDCLAKGNGTDGSNLFSGQEIAERGNLCSVGSDETSGSINSLEHSGRARERLEQGIRSVSGDSTGIEGGIGDSVIDLRQGGIPCRFGHFGSDRIDTGNRQNAECPHYKTENCPLKTVHCQLDTGFRVLKLDSTNMRDVYYAAGEYTQDLLSRMEDNIKDDRTDMDLLYACLLDWGLPLSMPHTQEKIDGSTVHTYNGGDLIACFDKRISEAVVREIAKRQPLRAVFRDSGFVSSPEKINVEEIFKLLAPGTSVKVL